MLAFDAYIRAIGKNLSLGNATEHTHRAALGALLESLEPGLTATNEPRRMTDVGAPDYILTRKGAPLGYVEAKDVGVDLRKTERGEQLKRYRAALPNLILTDYLEFRHYVNGEHRATARVAEETDGGKLRVDKSGIKEAERLIGSFLATKPPEVGTPRELAGHMAARAREIRNLIVRTFEQEGSRGQLHTQLEAFRGTLIPDLRPEAFADMYAQTIAYGLFAARTTARDPANFDRWNAARDLPMTNPFLGNFFDEIAGRRLDERVAWIVDDLAELLRRSKMDAILDNFGRRTRTEDPVVHFYETFLNAYDPKERERRGVYYTPEPVVSYIVRSVDEVLKTKFGRSLGLADPDTRILDPATGTATFLYHVIRHVHETLQEQGQLGAWSGYVRDELLPRIFGFELLMAPYTVAHMKLGILLQELGYNFGSSERLGVYLTNTLEEGVHSKETLGLAEYIAEEADAATDVKNKEPIEVIVGNPPYSGISTNMGEWITGLIDDYEQVDGKPLGERKHWLNDDYVKFIRFGQWRVEKTGRGVLAFVTNHGYLENPTFRGMRQSLMRTFTDIYLLDLHGNSLKKETAPDGGKDENVFDIRQGVAIGIFVKEPGKTSPAKVHHLDLWGLRKGKYEWLDTQDVENTEWTEPSPRSPFYLFAPQDMNLWAEYEQGWKITEMMPVSTTGIITARDKFVIDFDKNALLSRIEDLRSEALSDEEVRSRYFKGKGAAQYAPGDSRGWKLPEARKKIFGDSEWKERVERYSYRLFDTRFLYYASWMVDWPRPEVMRHLLTERNFALNVCRQTVSETWQHTFVTDALTDDSFVSNKTRERGYALPLYLYPRDDNLLDAAETERKPNLSPGFTRDLSEKLGLRFVPDGGGDLAETFGPEDVFHYAYAVFHSPTYRERYAEFLKRDFPRLPLTSDRALFAALAGKGAELVSLHLMTSPALNKLITRFPESGDNVVERVRHDAANRRVHINNEQYFDGVPEEVWEFRVGGYQVLDKWLKDRKGRALSYADIRHYQRIVVALSETRRLMREIDEAIPGWPLG